MKSNAVVVLMSLILVAPTFRGLAGAGSPEPGPEVDGLRLRLVVVPHPQDGKDGFNVRADLINVSREVAPLRAVLWRSEGHQGGFEAYLEAGLSIESYPAFEPWRGQVIRPREGLAADEPEYKLKPGKTLSVHWRATGRRLKNTVSDPLEAQNPEFTERGLYSVHASISLAVSNRLTRLRSNEQLAPIGGSREAPRPTYCPLAWVDERAKTATLGLGLLDKVAQGDRFRIESGYIGMTWTLTITNVQTDHAAGYLVPSQANPTPLFPWRGAYATLIPNP